MWQDPKFIYSLQNEYEKLLRIQKLERKRVTFYFVGSPVIESLFP